MPPSTPNLGEKIEREGERSDVVDINRCDGRRRGGDGGKRKVSESEWLARYGVGIEERGAIVMATA